MMTPSELSAALRSIADRIGNSSNPSRSAVSSELRRVLAGFGQEPQAQQAAPATKVVISDNWMDDDLPNIVSEHGGVAVRRGHFGEYGIEMPADQAAQFEADVGEGAHIFSSWDEASKAASEPGEEYVFEAVKGFPFEPGGSPSPGPSD